MNHLRPAPAILVTLAAVLPGFAAAQTDDQTQELLEKERRYYQRQTGEEEKEDEPQTPAVDPEGPDVAAFLAEADQLIRDRNYDMRRGDHCRVQTDDPRLRAGAAAVLLDSFRRFFESFWDGRMELRPYEESSRIFLFYSYFKYNQLLTGSPRFDEFRSSGHYRPYFDVVVIHSDSLGGPAALPDTLVHEAAHQQIARRLYGPGNDEINWVSEGMASYFGFTARDSSGDFQPGAIGGKGLTLLRGESRPSDGAGRKRLQAYRRQIKKSPPPVHEVLSMVDPAEYYGGDLQARYSLSWMLVHYLFHGEEGALSGGFLRYLEADREGEPRPEVLYRETGRPAEALAAGLRSYVLDLKGRPKRK